MKKFPLVVIVNVYLIGTCMCLQDVDDPQDVGNQDIGRTYSSSNIAPFPPHPDYVGESASAHQQEEEDPNEDPETKWQEVRKKLSFRPVDHSFFKTKMKPGKHNPTLPYAPTQPFTDLEYALNQVRRAVYKVSPSRRLANDAYKKFNVAVKVS